MKILIDSIKSEYLKENQVVLDIESTGVDRINSHIQLLAVLTGGEKGNFLQIFTENAGGEKDLLLKLKELIHEKTVISYNGISFDIPFILARMEQNGINPPTIRGQIDLYRSILDQRFFTWRESYSLQAIEKEAGFKRYENFELKKDRNFYKNVEDEGLAKILVHNRYDVINTEKLMGYLEKINKNRTLYLTSDDREANPIYIEKVSLNNNIFRMKMKTKKESPLMRYEDQVHLFTSREHDIELMVKVFYGHISKNDLGWVHIQAPPFYKDRSEFKLPEEILLINYKSLFILENARTLAKKYLDLHFPNK